MDMHTRFILESVAVAALTMSANAAHPALAPRVALLSQVSVADTQVILSDLLPANAPNSLRTLAAGIPLGAAPLPGSIRVLDRNAVERSAGASQKVLSEISIPERIFVSREVRPITLAEVFEAVCARLKDAGVAGADSLQPEEISFEPRVLVGPGDPGLRVTNMEIDRELQSAKFRLWPSRDPNILPFFVTARLGGKSQLGPVQASTKLEGLAQNNPPTIVPRSAVKHAPRQEFLVAQGERAALILHSADLRMFVDVVSLEPGALGQQIHVRILEDGKILSAVVDGPAHLDAKF